MTPGILCPHCGHDSTRITDTRKQDGGLLRYRLCQGCAGTFSTEEVVRDARPDPIQPRASRAATMARFRYLTTADIRGLVDGLPDKIVFNLLVWWDEARWSKWRTSAVWTRRAFAGSAARIRELHQRDPDLAHRLVVAGTEEGWQTLKPEYLGPALVPAPQQPAEVGAGPRDASMKLAIERWNQQSA